MRNCPRCASEITKNMKACPRCGLPVSQMDDYLKKFNLSSEESEQPEENEVPEKKLTRKEKKLLKKAEKQARRERESKSDTDFTQYVNADLDDSSDDTYSERRKKRRERQNRPNFDIDENGEFNIDTADVEIVGEETGKIIDERFEQSYSVKKSRGDYRQPKIKWWEIYKIADRHFARRKIRKEVNKAARIKPSFISKAKLLLLAIFLGWTGAQNFYAKNKRKGWVSVISLIFWVGIPLLGYYVPFFQKIEISVAGFAGLVNILIWITDIFNIIFNKFKYRLQIDKFISEMNVETRAKLGEKYIDLELYFSPWWVRLKAWFKKKKRNYEEYKRDSRQAKIDRQKRKLQLEEEKKKLQGESIEANVSQNTFIDEKTLNELKSFGEPSETDTQKAKKQAGENGKAKQTDKKEETSEEIDASIFQISPNLDGSNKTTDAEQKGAEQKQSDEVETKTTKAKKGTVSPAKKYPKTVKNKKAIASKKKK